MRLGVPQARGSPRQPGGVLCRGARGACQAEGLWHQDKYRKPKVLNLHTHRRKKGWASCPGVELLALAGGWGEPVRGSLGFLGFAVVAQDPGGVDGVTRCPERCWVLPSFAWSPAFCSFLS